MNSSENPNEMLKHAKILINGNNIQRQIAEKSLVELQKKCSGTSYALEAGQLLQSLHRRGDSLLLPSDKDQRIEDLKKRWHWIKSLDNPNLPKLIREVLDSNYPATKELKSLRHKMVDTVTQWLKPQIEMLRGGKDIAPKLQQQITELIEITRTVTCPQTLHKTLADCQAEITSRQLHEIETQIVQALAGWDIDSAKKRLADFKVMMGSAGQEIINELKRQIDQTQQLADLLNEVDSACNPASWEALEHLSQLRRKLGEERRQTLPSTVLERLTAQLAAVAKSIQTFLVEQAEHCKQPVSLVEWWRGASTSASEEACQLSADFFKVALDAWQNQLIQAIAAAESFDALENLTNELQAYEPKLPPTVRPWLTERLNELQEAFVKMSERHIQDLRYAYDEQDSVQELLESDPEISALKRCAGKLLQEFIDELEELQELQHQCRDGQLLNDGMLDTADLTLAKLAENWGFSLSYQRLAEELKKLRKELNGV